MGYRPVPLHFDRLEPEEQLARSRAFLELMRTRRSVRRFSTEPVQFELIENAIATAGTSPSGAHQQPWSFVVVADPETKRRIREAAEIEERRNYEGRMSPEWIAALESIGTTPDKPHIEDAPCLIVVFEQAYGPNKEKHYYVKESVGIACGLLLASLHTAGLATLTHTPSPMGFLARILERPPNERAYLLVPVGYPAPDAEVPDLERKPLDEILVAHAP
jgi:iodotyrosine deiodinase